MKFAMYLNYLKFWLEILQLFYRNLKFIVLFVVLFEIWEFVFFKMLLLFKIWLANLV